MTASKELKRGECKLRYLRALESKQKEIENKERRCQSLSSTLEDLRERLITIRTERDKLEEECLSKIDAEELRQEMVTAIKSFCDVIRCLEVSLHSETDILAYLFFSSVDYFASICAFAEHGFRGSRMNYSLRGSALLVDIARSLGCVLPKDWKSTLDSNTLQQISNIWLKLIRDIVEAKRTQKSE